MPPSRARGPEDQRLSDELARWLTGEGDKTIAGLIETFKEKSFAVLFAVLLGPAALPLPTGGVTRVLEAIAMLFADAAGWNRPIRFAKGVGGHAAALDVAEEARRRGVRRLVLAHIGRPAIGAIDAGERPPFGIFGKDGAVFEPRRWRT